MYLHAWKEEFDTLDDLRPYFHLLLVGQEIFVSRPSSHYRQLSLLIFFNSDEWYRSMQGLLKSSWPLLKGILSSREKRGRR